jgi:hypothetical protein
LTGQYFHISGARGVGEFPAERFAGKKDGIDGTDMIGVGVQRLIRRVVDRCLLAAAPEETPTHDLRMQSTHKDGGAPQRYVGSDEPLTEIRQDNVRRRRRKRPID